MGEQGGDESRNVVEVGVLASPSFCVLLYKMEIAVLIHHQQILSVIGDNKIKYLLHPSNALFLVPGEDLAESLQFFLALACRELEFDIQPLVANEAGFRHLPNTEVPHYILLMHLRSPDLEIPLCNLVQRSSGKMIVRGEEWKRRESEGKVAVR